MVAGIHPLREAVDLAGKRLSLLRERLLPLGELLGIGAGLGRAFDIALPRDRLRKPGQKLLHFLLRVGELPAAVAGLEQIEQLPQLLERRGLPGSRLEQLPLLEELHDQVEPIADFLLAGLLEDAPEQRRPPRVARGEQIGQPQKRLLQLVELLHDRLLARGERRRIGGLLLVGGGAKATAEPAQQDRQDRHRSCRPADVVSRLPDRFPDHFHGCALLVALRLRALRAPRGPAASAA